ncbi:MAG: polyprenyl synthetase family protein [Rikenellaceae bacterium]
MIELSQIRKPLEKQMIEFDTLFKQSLSNDIDIVESLSNYAMTMQGKQMRPLFLFLSAALHGTINEKCYDSAIFIELIHTASLIHDDVVDEAFMRRGKWSIGTLERSKLAVLFGDYVLSRGLKIAVKSQLYETIEMMSDIIEQMSVGELLQSSHAIKLDTTTAQYYDIVRRKTALLLASCGASGAIAAGGNREDRDRMFLFGEKLGVAFQIKDDILDFTTSSKTGKIACNDLKERKLTLPILSILEKSSGKERKLLLSLIRSARESEKSAEKIREVVINGGGIENAIEQMDKLKQEALEILEHYPDSEIKESLRLYTEFILNRTK